MQDNCSKEMPWLKVAIQPMGQTSTIVPESSLFPDLMPKSVHYNTCSILEDRFERLVMLPISSPMAWGGNQVKRHSIASFHGKASSHGKGCSCVPLPPSAIVLCSGCMGYGSL